MKFGTLTFQDVNKHSELVAQVAKDRLAQREAGSIFVTAIDASLADTAAFCEAYDVALAQSANCVVVQAKRGEDVWYAACMILATDKVDVNGAVRRTLGARKISFAPMDEAVSRTGMEYGGITPIGLPEGWPILVDERVAKAGNVIIGSGIRASKLLLDGALLAGLPGASTLDIAKHE